MSDPVGSADREGVRPGVELLGPSGVVGGRLVLDSGVRDTGGAVVVGDETVPDGVPVVDGPGCVLPVVEPPNGLPGVPSVVLVLPLDTPAGTAAAAGRPAPQASGRTTSRAAATHEARPVGRCCGWRRVSVTVGISRRRSGRVSL